MRMRPTPTKEADPDWADCFQQLTNLILNERVKAFNEGFDAATAETWLSVDTAPRGIPVQVVCVDDPDHHWLPMTACLEFDKWTRPASRDGLPYKPTHWRALPASPPRQSRCS